MTTPPIDRLLADPKVVSDVHDRPAGIDKVKNTTAKLRWIPLASHQLLLSEAA